MQDYDQTISEPHRLELHWKILNQLNTVKFDELAKNQKNVLYSDKIEALTKYLRAQSKFDPQ